MLPLRIALRWCSASLLCLLVATLAAADERQPAELFPKTTVAYLDVREPSAVIDLLQEHPLRKRIEALKGVREAYQSKQYLEFKAVVAIVEAKLGQTWPRVLEAAAANGLAVGVDAETSGVAVLAKARDEQTWPEIVSTLVELARADARDKGNPDPIKAGEHRGINAYQVDKAKLAAFGPWLLVTNNGDLGQAMLNNYLDKPEQTLATQEQFQQAREAVDGKATAWGYVNVEEVRNRGAAKQLFAGKTDNPAVELLVGGLLDTLKRTPYVTVSLTLNLEQAQLELNSPHQADWVSDGRTYFFGPDGKGVAPALLTVQDQLLAVSAYRDVSLMWLQAGDLFEEQVVDRLAEADSNLSTLFSGKDFGEEILGSVHPEVQIVVARQRFEEGTPRPAIKLPAFALAFRLKDPEIMEPELRRTFQSLIGFLNVVGAMNAQPQLDLDMEKSERGQIVTATYLAEQDRSPTGLKIHYNFSPSVAFVGDRFVVSSTRELARELSSLLVSQAANLKSNSAVVANLAAITQILEDNRGQLVAQNMLEEGHTKEEAEQEIGDLLSLIAAIREASLSLDAADGELHVVLSVDFKASGSE